MVDYRAICPPFIPASQDRCQLHATLAAAELLQAIKRRPYIKFSRVFVDAHQRIIGLAHGTYPPPSISDVVQVVTQIGMVAESDWPGSNYPVEIAPTAAVNAAAAAHRLVMTQLRPDMKQARPYHEQAIAHLETGHPLVFATLLNGADWPSGTPDMYQVPVPRNGEAANLAHAAMCLGYDSYGFIVREARTPNFIAVPFDYFTMQPWGPGSWWAVTDVIEVAPPAKR